MLFCWDKQKYFSSPSSKAESEITDSKDQFSKASQIYVFKISVLLCQAFSKENRSTNRKKKHKNNKPQPGPFNDWLLCLQYGLGLLFPRVGKLQLGLVWEGNYNQLQIFNGCHLFPALRESRSCIRALSASNSFGGLDAWSSYTMPRDPGTTFFPSSKPTDHNNLYEILKWMWKSLIIIIQKTVIATHCSMKN